MLIFSTTLGSLYCDEALVVLKNIADGSVDLVIADPPYKIGKASWDRFKTIRCYEHWADAWISECMRILKSTGTMYVFGFSEILSHLLRVIELYEGNCKWLVWHYKNKANLRDDWGRSHESIICYRKSNEFKFNTDDVRVPYNEHTMRYPDRKQGESSQYGDGGCEWTPHPRGAKPSDVFEIPVISNGSWEKTEHPTQKPVELIKRLILASSNVGDLVVDPFGGSGTTYFVAEAYERRWIGSERECKYCDMAIQRFEDLSKLRPVDPDTIPLFTRSYYEKPDF